jgi:hypothetical protein
LPTLDHQLTKVLLDLFHTETIRGAVAEARQVFNGCQVSLARAHRMATLAHGIDHLLM